MVLVWVQMMTRIHLTRYLFQILKDYIHMLQDTIRAHLYLEERRLKARYYTQVYMPRVKNLALEMASLEIHL